MLNVNVEDNIPSYLLLSFLSVILCLRTQRRKLLPTQLSTELLARLSPMTTRMALLRVLVQIAPNSRQSRLAKMRATAATGPNWDRAYGVISA